MDANVVHLQEGDSIEEFDGSAHNGRILSIRAKNCSVIFARRRLGNILHCNVTISPCSDTTRNEVSRTGQMAQGISMIEHQARKDGIDTIKVEAYDYDRNGFRCEGHDSALLNAGYKYTWRARISQLFRLITHEHELYKTL